MDLAGDLAVVGVPPQEVNHGPRPLESMPTKTPLTEKELRQVWEVAARFDDSLTLQPGLLRALSKKRVEPVPFSRTLLFKRMLACEPSLFSHFPIRPRVSPRESKNFSLMEAIRSGFPRAKRARVRARGAVEHLPIPSVLDKWMRAKSVFGVTDLHYIGTRFDARMDTTGLNDFNLLPRGDQGFQSQDSLVISSMGAVTDSHSDDHGGSNHSFVGTKVWLLWETLEGFEHGLEDVERGAAGHRAAFDLASFLAMRSSCWILIGPGQTMFIPAHLTHKVITLQQYLGLGSFHAGLPGFVDLLTRWAKLPPLWVAKGVGNDRCTVDFITRRAIRKVQSLRKASRSERLRWGVPYLRARLQLPDASDDAIHRDPALRDNSNLKSFIQAARQL